MNMSATNDYEDRNSLPSPEAVIKAIALSLSIER
jgi:hypothetical protein